MTSFQNLTILLFGLFTLVNISCNPDSKISDSISENKKWTGSVEVNSPEMNRFFDSGQQVEILATGFEWTEGPVWVDMHNMLLFSDIPRNKIYKWTEEDGVSTYLNKSGYSGESPRGGEPGSNGLALNRRNDLILCQHGDRAISIMAAPLTEPKPEFIHLADNYEKKSFNSPNDLYIDSLDNIYFTDPPYGLEDGMQDLSRQLEFQGVFSLSRNGNVKLISQTISRPNGISLINDDRELIVANSDPEDPKWYRFGKNEEGEFVNKSVFHDASAALQSAQGLPDGLKWHPDGFLFATGPGGVWVMDGTGKLVGKILTGRLTANCAFDSDYSFLYMTADDALLRISLKPGDENPI